MVTGRTVVYTLSLHDALPIFGGLGPEARDSLGQARLARGEGVKPRAQIRHRRQVISLTSRSEEHTSELQSRPQLVCRLLPEKKKSTGQRRSWPHVVGREVRPC